MKKIILVTLLTLIAFACTTPSNYVKIKTNYGDITIELFDETPLHRDNFKKLVEEGFYDDLLFHRVIDSFMVQGGDPESRDAKAGGPLGSGDPGYTIPAEFDASARCYHRKGVLAAAREGDNTNPQKESSGSQFYIVVGRPYSKGELNQIDRQHMKEARQTYFGLLSIAYADTLEALLQAGDRKAYRTFQKQMTEEAKSQVIEDADKIILTPEQRRIYQKVGGTPHLDGDYTVFGQVIEGIEVVEAISKAKKNRRDRPIKDIKMTMKFVKN